MRPGRFVPRGLLALLLGAAAPGPLRAQLVGDQSLGVGIHFQGYEFDEALGAKVANLVLFPVAYRVSWGTSLRTDLYAAYARGAVEQGGRTFLLSGMVDTRLRASWQATPWAVVTLALNLPTGNETHTSGEALVANVLATDLLGFREASWGTGFAVTSGVATAYRAGPWGVGFGASYRVAGGFEPSADTSFTYTPGNESRVRLAVDRTFGQSKLTGGLTFQRFTADQVDGRNLFQSGNRLRVDATYAFRAGPTTWTLYAADIWRENGDVTLAIVDAAGAIVGDTTFATPSQNLLVVGAVGAVPLTPGLSIRPTADFRLQTREEEAGEGWILGLGADVPLRLLATYDLFPRGRFLLGAMKTAEGVSKTLWGGELGLTVRWRP